MAPSKKKNTNEDDEELVRSYMERQNRPFSVQNILDAHQKNGLKKASCERALASLVDKGRLVVKEYGKSKVYVFRQDNIELPDKEEMAAMDASISENAARLKDIQGTLAELKSEVDSLEASLTLDEAREKKAALVESNQKSREKVDALGDVTNLVPKEEKDRIFAEYRVKRDAWRVRKKYVKEMIDTISEPMGTKPADLATEIGIETDEEAGVEIHKLPDLPQPNKRARRP